MIYVLDGLLDVSFSIFQGLRTLMGHFIAAIFFLIEYAYKIFEYLAKAQVLDNEYVESVYYKVAMLLGVFMIFKLSFSLINSLIDPNKFSDKKNGFTSIIFRSVIAIVLFGLTPAIFKEAYNIQELLLGRYNIIYKLVAPADSTVDLDNIGRQLASDLYFSFYTDEDSPKLNLGVSDSANRCSNYSVGEYCDRFIADNFDNLKKDVEEGKKSFSDTVDYLALRSTDDNGIDTYVIEFKWLPLLVVGGLTLWVLVLYCVQVGIRVIQLAFLQLIAPIPILSYISDPDGTFKRWLKQCTSTFLDLFFRLAIIYFVMTTIGSIIEQFGGANGIILESTGIGSEDWFTVTLVKVIIIFGLLLFATKVPKLIKDLFPNLGGGAGMFDFGIKSPKQAWNDYVKTPITSIPVAGKAIGWMGKKASTAISAPVKKKVDVFKQNRKNRIEGRAESRANDAKFKLGERLSSMSDVSGAFEPEYAVTYNQLKLAKKNLASSDDDLRRANAELSNAYRTGDQGSISKAEANYKKIEEDNRDAKKQLDLAKARHDVNRKKYTASARKEDAYNYYQDVKKLNGMNSYSSQYSSSNSSPANPSVKSTPTQQPSQKSVQSVPQTPVQQPSDQEIKITKDNSMFANMSDAEFEARQNQNFYESEAQISNPNDYFDSLYTDIANDYVNNNDLSDEYSNFTDDYLHGMEEAYKKAGWTKGSDGKWTKDN